MDRLVDEQGNLTEKNTVKVRCGYVRGKDFEDFYLTVNQKGLPFTHSDPQDNIYKLEQDYSVPNGNVKDAFGIDDVEF
jgi:hypothetical protein